MKKNIAIKHHYVPRFILKNFSCDNTKKNKNKKVYVFDKHENKLFKSNINNIGCQNNFYSFKLFNKEISIENNLAVIDGDAASIINKLIENENLSELSDSERITLSVFIAIQITRTPQQRTVYASLHNDIFQKFSNGKNLETKEINEEDIKSESCLFMIDFCETAPILIDKSWALIKAPDGESFKISDHPVTLQNSQPNPSLYGNIGIACKGIEIYFPLSKRLSLALFCTSIEQEMNVAIQKLTSAFSLTKNINLKNKIDAINKSRETIKNNSTTTAAADQVTKLNSLQTKWSNRYVYSHNKDFSLTEKMIADNPKFKTGMTLTAN